MIESTATRPRIIVGVDGSAGSRLALEWAARIAASEAAVIDVVGVWEYPVNLGWTALPAEYSPKQDMEKAVVEIVDDVFGPDRPPGLRVAHPRGQPRRRPHREERRRDSWSSSAAAATAASSACSSAR